MQFHHNVFRMRTTLEEVLRVVGDELGSAGSMDPKNVPKAAAVLGEYADLFSRMESNANYSALQLQELIDRLSR
jgi:hypothetical protein